MKGPVALQELQQPVIYQYFFWRSEHRSTAGRLYRPLSVEFILGLPPLPSCRGRAFRELPVGQTRGFSRPPVQSGTLLHVRSGSAQNLPEAPAPPDAPPPGTKLFSADAAAVAAGVRVSATATTCSTRCPRSSENRASVVKPACSPPGARRNARSMANASATSVAPDTSRTAQVGATCT